MSGGMYMRYVDLVHFSNKCLMWNINWCLVCGIVGSQGAGTYDRVCTCPLLDACGA